MYGCPLILLPDVCELPVKRQRKKKGQRKGGGGKQRKPGAPRDKAAARAAGGWRGAAKRQWADLERRHGPERV